jgi:hypothetical protein
VEAKLGTGQDNEMMGGGSANSGAGRGEEEGPLLGPNLGLIEGPNPENNAKNYTRDNNHIFEAGWAPPLPTAWALYS